MSSSGDSNRWHADWDAQRERLSAYLDGELTPDEAAALERHLADCHACQTELASLREVRALLGALPPPALPRSFALPETGAPPARTALPDRVTPLAPRTPVPPRRAPARRSGFAAARAAQWLGGIAAVLGLALLLSSALAGHGPVTYSSGGFGPRLGSGGASTTSHPVGPTSQGAAPTATRTATGVPGETTAPNSDTRTAAGEPPPLLPLAGGGLLLGGGLLIVGGTVARRRRRQRAPPA
ncbi:MAG TPA: zf-HC2 domain-containing protein [Ktedonobacterales bacterium]|nr:zf-HC2 domain-containing protein [Ktedonobacterales bacterium]